MSSLRDVIHTKLKNSAQYEKVKTVTTGVTVCIDNALTPDVAGRPGYVWVRENAQDGGVFQCFNPVVKSVAGLPVIISRGALKSSMRMIEAVDWSSLAVVVSDTDGVALQIPRHHRDHEWPDTYPGNDVVNVYPRSIVPLRVYPGSAAVTLSVSPGYYMYNSVSTYYPGLSNDDTIQSYIPPSSPGYAIVLVYIDVDTGLVDYLVGTVTEDPEPTRPSIPDGVLQLAYVYLYAEMLEIVEQAIVEDVRPVFSLSSSEYVTTQAVNDKFALMEAEWDYELTRHVVEG